MKSFKQHILEKLKVTKGNTVEYTLFPKTREELKQMINEEISKNGYECSLNHIDVSEITDMSRLFFGSKFNGGISDWDVSNVTDMTSMFNSSKFNGDISNWDVSNVISMMYMFNDCAYSGKYGGISKWDVSNVINMQGMFNNCNFNDDLSKWNVAKVEWFIWMFRNSNFSGDISNWNINPRAKGHMDGMFINSPLGNTPPRWYYKYR